MAKVDRRRGGWRRQAQYLVRIADWYLLLFDGELTGLKGRSHGLFEHRGDTATQGLQRCVQRRLLQPGELRCLKRLSHGEVACTLVVAALLIAMLVGDEHLIFDVCKAADHRLLRPSLDGLESLDGVDVCSVVVPSWMLVEDELEQRLLGKSLARRRLWFRQERGQQLVPFLVLATSVARAIVALGIDVLFVVVVSRELAMCLRRPMPGLEAGLLGMLRRVR